MGVESLGGVDLERSRVKGWGEWQDVIGHSVPVIIFQLLSCILFRSEIFVGKLAGGVLPP